MKYSKVELEILKKEGKKGLEKYHKAKRKALGNMAPKVVESKKYKEKYKPVFV